MVVTSSGHCKGHSVAKGEPSITYSKKREQSVKTLKTQESECFPDQEFQQHGRKVRGD